MAWMKVPSLRSYPSVLSPSAKILQGCVVAIDSGGCCRSYASSLFLLPPPFFSLLQASLSLPPLLVVSLPRPSNSSVSSVSRAVSLPRTWSVQVASTPKGLKLPAQFPRSFQLLKYAIAKSLFWRRRQILPEIQSPSLSGINSESGTISRILHSRCQDESNMIR